MSDTTNETATAPAGLSAAEVAELRKKAGERDQYLDMAQRTRAEFENYQKRNQKDREMERRYAHGPLVRDILPVMDNLDRALLAARQAGRQGPPLPGVARLANQVLPPPKRPRLPRPG